MADQSFSEMGLERMLRKSDFRDISPSDYDSFRQARISEAISAATTLFNSPSNPLVSFSLKGKTVYRIPNLGNELVARRLRVNLKRLVAPTNKGRASIVKNLSLLLQEGVPYRVYRLDVSSFYESFEADFIKKYLEKFLGLSPQSRALLDHLLLCQTNMGGTGLPRGLALSALLSDFFMRHFDDSVNSHSSVFFYARYVDDIIVVTSAQEDVSKFTESLSQWLPEGLSLNKNKKSISTAKKAVSPSTAQGFLFKFDYLGYCFKVSDPVKNPKIKSSGSHFRDLSIDIGESKILRVKTRISKALISYKKTLDWKLLLDRLKFLTQNFSVYDFKTGISKLAGIYHSYPAVSENSPGLIELDMFLKDSILYLSKKYFAISFTSSQRRVLLGHSFLRGHKNKIFKHFSGERISEIQECWRG